MKPTLFKRIDERKIPKWYRINRWEAEPKDVIFSQIDGYIICPISHYFQVDDDSKINYFSIRPKRGYNKDKRRIHFIHTLNYFEKFYDGEKELLSIYANMKFFMDIKTDLYNEKAFVYDLKKYILDNPIIQYKIDRMNRDNYIPIKVKFTGKDECLYYDNNHLSIMMKISIMMIICIPLLTHFAYKNRIQDIDRFLLDTYLYIIKKFEDEVDLYSKFYETCHSNISRNKTKNSIWNNQDIRGINVSTHTDSTVDDIILNIIPQYVYDDNPAMLNYVAVNNGIKFKITDVNYDFVYRSLSSSLRDADENSEFDKYESYLAKTDESLVIINEVNAEDTNRRIASMFNDITDEEINYYRYELKGDDSSVIHPFQKELLFLIFAKYFGNMTSEGSINEDDYIRMICVVFRLLISKNKIVLPFVFSSKITRFTRKQKLSKKDKDLMVSDPLFKQIQDKYKSKKAENIIETYIATILASDFSIIQYNPDPENDFRGLTLPKPPGYVIHEIEEFVLMI